MTDSNEKQKMTYIGPKVRNFSAIITKSTVIEEGTPTRYYVKPSQDSHAQSEPYQLITFGQRDKKKPHKTILIVGETGTGKTKLINTTVNYMLGVQREDKVWFEITDDQSNEKSVYSQTSSITVYEFYLEESPMDLTIIDTPGYGDTHGLQKDKDIAMNLLGLCKCYDWDNKLDAVCLVIKATQNRLSDRQIYIYDAVQSLFGSDIAENIVLLFTFSRGAYPKVALKAVEEAKIQCAVNEQKNQPVFFLFDNCQGETFLEEYQMVQEQSWNLSSKGIKGFFSFFDTIKPKPMKMTQDVLKQRKQLEENISKIQLYDQDIMKAQRELEKQKKDVKGSSNFEYEVDVPYKEWVDIDRSVASMAMCCTVCEENCHYPGCWWVRDLSWCSVMRDNHCIVCPKKCHYSKHVKAAKIYVTKTKEKRTDEASKNKYTEHMTKMSEMESEIKKLEKELQDLETQKIKLVFGAFHCVDTLEKIALNTYSLIILLHTEFLIEKMKEINEPEKAEILEDMRKRAGEGKLRALGYTKEGYTKLF